MSDIWSVWNQCFLHCVKSKVYAMLCRLPAVSLHFINQYYATFFCTDADYINQKLKAAFPMLIF